MIAEHRQNIGDKAFIVYNKKEMSFFDVDVMANKVGAFLKKKDVRPGDKITLLMGNRPDFITALLAVWKLGAVCVPANTGYTSDELVFSINHSSVQVSPISITNINPRRVSVNNLLIRNPVFTNRLRCGRCARNWEIGESCCWCGS